MYGNKRIQFLRIYMWELRQPKRQQQTCHVSSSNKEEEEEEEHKLSNTQQFDHNYPKKTHTFTKKHIPKKQNFFQSRCNSTNLANVKNWSFANSQMQQQQQQQQKLQKLLETSHLFSPKNKKNCTKTLQTKKLKFWFK